MELPDELLCVFSAEVSEQADSYRIEVPKREVETGDVRPGDVHRVAVFATDSTDEASEGDSRDRSESRSGPEPRGEPRPPVEEGEQRTVDIEDIGEQGDGIARVERGFVIIVPDTEQGERVTIEVTDVQQNVAFGEVVERENYYV
ncbi:TRAM domain-containing protein [Halomicrobium salinisoli]|uniref:TRAM domain-containing protein n=1 Tax=Halomicrobium salinisoli TaxID=2878391 RepID=UPI001CEFE7B8|nr:TRAM domain-containing protein [Halomicrobium salinisoli]